MAILIISMPDINNKITLEEIQNLLIEKKFVRIESDRYTDDAYDFIRSLIDQEHAILFDKSKHRIYTLGDYYGGDVFKENLYFYSKIKHIDIDDTIIEEINAIAPESELSIESKDGINISFENEKITFGLSIKELIEENSNSKYKLIINDNNKIDIVEYHTPVISINKVEFNPNKTQLTLAYQIDSINNPDDWEEFDVECENCELVSLNKTSRLITISTNSNNYYNHINEKIKFVYNDSYKTGEIIIDGIYNIYAFYGTYDINYSRFIQLGKINIDDIFTNVITINQRTNERAYIQLPSNMKVIFMDSIRNIQGAWYKQNTTVINNLNYKTYCTTNDKLGKMSWKIINNQ